VLNGQKQLSSSPQHEYTNGARAQRQLTQTHHPGMVLRGMMYAPVVISTEVENTAHVTE
jgi:hypothetical protein